MSERIVLAGAVRTPIGKFGGTLAEVPVEKLGALVIEEALRRAGVAPGQVDEVLMGCILQTCRGQNVARQAALGAGLPVEVPAMTLNNVCGSGLKAVNMAADAIRSGSAEIVVAGGMENMSAAPYALEKARSGFRMGDGRCVDTMVLDALTDAFSNEHMGVTAENVAGKYGITREMQDEFAAESQRKCEAAWNAGRFDEEIVPVPVTVKKQTVLFGRDEHPRAGVSAGELSALKPAFKKEGGTVTAGNASGINDGAAAVVVVSERKAKELGVVPMAVFEGGSGSGVDPSVMGSGRAFGTRKLLEGTGRRIAECDLIDANE